MKKCKSIASILGSVLAFMVAATAADSPSLTFKFTATHVKGAIQTFPTGVNNAGVTVGQYQDKNNVFHGYILNGKKLTTVDDPKGTGTLCTNLNPNGAIAVVGSYTNSSGDSVGFRYKNGKFRDIRGPGGATASVAYG